MADMAWTGAATPTETFDHAFGTLFLGDAAGSAVAAIHRLGRAVEQPGLGRRTGPTRCMRCLKTRWRAAWHSYTPAAVLDDLAAAAEAALPAFALLPDATLRHELQSAAWQINIVCRTQSALGTNHARHVG